MKSYMALRVTSFVLLSSLSAFSSACVVEHDVTGPSRGYGGTYGGAMADSGNVQPLLVVVDNDQVMTAAPGEGAGVFVEYGSGGHWHLRWTCDVYINPSPQPCPFDIRVSVDRGAIGKIQGDRAGNEARVFSQNQIGVTTLTTKEVDGIRFDTTPGAIITVDASIGGVRSPGYLFFVQNQQINGGIDPSRLSDPLSFVGQRP